MSFAFSIPTEIRISPSLFPSSFLRAGARLRPGQLGVINSTNSRIITEPLGQRARIFAMPVHTHRECFQAAQNLVRLPRAQNATYKFHYTDQGVGIDFIA